MKYLQANKDNYNDLQDFYCNLRRHLVIKMTLNVNYKIYDTMYDKLTFTLREYTNHEIFTT